MSSPQNQISSLTDAVGRLIDAYTSMKARNRELQEKLDAAEEALIEARQANSHNHNTSTPSPAAPALSASELDALVEEIDSCIALLKT